MCGLYVYSISKLILTTLFLLVVYFFMTHLRSSLSLSLSFWNNFIFNDERINNEKRKNSARKKNESVDCCRNFDCTKRNSTNTTKTKNFKANNTRITTTSEIEKFSHSSIFLIFFTCLIKFLYKVYIHICIYIFTKFNILSPSKRPISRDSWLLVHF